REEGERLREHYRRLQYARIHFPLTVSRRFYGRLDAYRAGNGEVDDRGLIYIRHGEPAQRLRPFIFGAMPNESWRYAQAEGDLLLHFSGGYDGNGGGDLYDYRLVESVLDLRGAADAPRDQLLLSRQSLLPAYSRMLNWGRYGAARAGAQERHIGRASIAVGTTTDSYELQFSRRVGAIADLVAVGRSGDRSLAHFVFGIAATDLSAEPGPTGVTYPVRVRLVAFDGAGHSVAKLDTMMLIGLPERLRVGQYLVGRAELSLPPGEWSYRASLQQGDSSGVVLPRDTVRVATGDGTSLSLSDLALGSRGRAVPWVTGAGDTVLLAPSTLFRKRSEIEVYYEANAAITGNWYRHEISVFRDQRPSGATRSPLVALSFEEAAGGPVIRSHRTIHLGQLKEGRYIVEVRVTDPSGRSQLRRRAIVLLDR
ncbi:MAG TPA: hypothetical protein VFU40_04475, partial [Gemmatimonadales bacterium]|nr:hypothetical protein [Gemmatimonadales bacterium]